MKSDLAKAIAAYGVIAAVVVSAIVVGCNRQEVSPQLKSAGVAAVPIINPVVTDCNQTTPVDSVTPAVATGGLPCTFAFNSKNVSLTTLQEAFDFNSWLTFVALNEPSDATSSGDQPSVWESWQDIFSLMLPDGSAPPPFGQSVAAPSICDNAGAGHVLQMISKTTVTPTLAVSGQPLRTGPLIDQNGHYVRYQILVNRPMYNYIVQNHLYSKAGQQQFTDSIAFPEGAVTAGDTGTVGAIVVKAAWKVLDPKDPNDNPAHFHVTHARVYTPAAEGVPASCHSALMGLVGLHIVHKTDTEPQWIWSTFEHVDNAPTEAEVASLPADAHFNFYKAGCSVKDCPPNKQPPQPWNPSVEPFPNGFHSQIVRATQYDDFAVQSAENWNAQFQAALPNAVWKNYKLVTTQWPTDAGNKIDPNGKPFPVYAANTTMETYVQGNVPMASSSCMACHGNATSMSGKDSDFSFVLEKAH